MPEQRVRNKHLSSPPLSLKEKVGGKSFSFFLSIGLHIIVISIGLLFSYHAFNAGGAVKIDETVPVYVTFVPDIDNAAKIPEMIEEPSPERNKGQVQQITREAIGTIPLPNKPKNKVKQSTETTQKQENSSASQRQVSKPVSSVSVTIQDFAADGDKDKILYTDRVRAIIESNRIYPSAARRRKLQGTAIIQIRIHRNGTILNHNIVKTTGHRILDQAVIEMVQASGPFPSIPLSIHTVPLSVEIPVGFQLR